MDYNANHSFCRVADIVCAAQKVYHIKRTFLGFICFGNSLARRKIENWILLNISNLVAIPLLFYKKLPMLALLTLFLFVIAFWGYFEWAGIYKKENREPEPALS